MSFDYFWVHPAVEGPMPGVDKCTPFSAGHLIYLAIVAILTFLYVRAYLKGNEKSRHNLRSGLALFMIFSEFAKTCLCSVQSVDPVWYLPLELCSLAEFIILIDSIWPENKVFNQLLLYAFMPAAIMALVFTSTEEFPVLNIYTIRFFLFHGAIAAYVIARFAAGEIHQKYSGLWSSILIVFVIVVLMYRFDTAYGYGFMFLTYHYNNPLLKVIWDLSGGTGGASYIAALTVFVCIVLHVVYFIFRLIDKGRRLAGSHH